jgi:hypothetical protein
MGTVEIYRYERKYVVSEPAAAAIRDFVSSYLPVDEHMRPEEPIGYRVLSLYLDTPSLGLYRQTCHGEKNRYKLRVRFYDTKEESPAFLEIKRRTTETIHKLRAVVSKQAAEALLRGCWLTPADLLSNSEGSRRALTEFCERRERLHACGAAFVSYFREAFVSPTAEAVRVTLDRKIAGHRWYREAGLNLPEEKADIPEKGVVLELKYNGRAPRWMHDLVTSFGLQRLSFPKYVYAVDALGIASDAAEPVFVGVRC